LQRRPQITSIARNSRFERDFKQLPIDIQVAAKEAIKDLLRDPIPATRRLHALTGFKNPKVYTIDVMPNHSYKISFEIDGSKAILRRVHTHKTIDVSP